MILRPKAAVVERDEQVEKLRAQVAAIGERLALVEAFLLALYGPGALGGAAPAPPPPAEPPRPPTRPIATMFSRR